MAIFEADGRVFSGTLAHRIEADIGVGGPSLECGWRCANGVLEAFADRLGFVPMFYWTEGPRFILSDSIVQLAGRLPQARFDDQAVAAYLQLGYYVGDTTLLAGVRVLPPASNLVWNGQLTIRDGVDFSRSAFPGTRSEAVEEYDRLFAKAVAERVSSRIGRITLSGGRDSRHILLELHRQGCLPCAAVTLRRRNSTDHQVASELARRVNIDCIVAGDVLDPFVVESTKNRLNFFMADENGWYLPLLDHLDGQVFDGLAGDVLSNGLYFEVDVADLIDRGEIEEAARLFVLKHGGYLSYLSRKAQTRFNADLAHDLIAGEFARHRDAPNPVQSFVFWNRTRREIALLPIGMARTKVDPLLPYTDRELLAFLLSLPYREFGAPGFHDEVINKVYPSFADVGYATKIKPSYRWRERLSYAANASRSLLGPFASSARILAYAGATISGPSLRAVDTPFSRLYPLIQAQRELGVKF